MPRNKIDKPHVWFTHNDVHFYAVQKMANFDFLSTRGDQKVHGSHCFYRSQLKFTDKTTNQSMLTEIKI